MTRRVALAGLLALAATTHARAGFITGVTASTNMGSASGSDIAHIVDGSGLSSLSLTATHAAGMIASNDWVSATGTPTGQVTFDLHGSYMLVGMSVWNFNGLNLFGVQGVSVSTSTDGMTFTSLAGGPTTFAEGALAASEAPQQFTFSVTAAFVRFDITSNYGLPGNTGLSEVAFDGTLVPTAVPAPPTLLLGLVGVGVTGVARLRRRGR
jgi:hypothetical protein